MAENSTSKNQQFLQQFEQQRLNKPCNRIIDLRGKVAGECQAYTFGGKTHYYLRLYCRTLNSPLFWLNQNDTVHSIKAFQLSEMAEKSMQVLRQENGSLDFSQLPFEQLITQEGHYLLLMSAQQGQALRYLAHRDKPEQVAHLLSLHKQHTDSRLLFVTSS